MILEPCPSNLVLITASTPVYIILHNFGRIQEHIPGCWLLMNLLGRECQADWMNSGHKPQTSTMTVFIQTWLPACRSTLRVINFHRPRISASTKLILRRKTHPGKWGWAEKTSYVFIPRLCIIRLICLVTDWHAQPEVLFKSSAFCYAIVILKKDKGKIEQHSLQWVICF